MLVLNLEVLLFSFTAMVHLRSHFAIRFCIVKERGRLQDTAAIIAISGYTYTGQQVNG